MQNFPLPVFAVTRVGEEIRGAAKYIGARRGSGAAPPFHLFFFFQSRHEFDVYAVQLVRLRFVSLDEFFLVVHELLFYPLHFRVKLSHQIDLLLQLLGGNQLIVPEPDRFQRDPFLRVVHVPHANAAVHGTSDQFGTVSRQSQLYKKRVKKGDKNPRKYDRLDPGLEGLKSQGPIGTSARKSVRKCTINA